MQSYLTIDKEKAETVIWFMLVDIYTYPQA